MKRIYVNEECVPRLPPVANTNAPLPIRAISDMVRALKGKQIHPLIHIEDSGDVHFAVNCRHCKDPICVKSCISGALSKGKDGIVRIDRDKCVGCLTCVLVCPVRRGSARARRPRRHEVRALHGQRQGGEPNCVKYCPNGAIVFETREEA